MAADILALLSHGLIATSGSPDYPGEVDVRAGVVYGDGDFTGTLAVGGTTTIYGSGFADTGDHTGEWRLWPRREDITLRAQTALGVYDSHPLTAPGGAAKRRAPTWKEMTASAGGVSAKNLVWLLPKQNLPDEVEPRAGYQIRDAAGVDHTVLEVQAGKFNQTHRCVTIALAVVYELSAVGVLTRPDGGQDAAGRPYPSYTEVARVRCRVQPQDSAAGDHFERRTTAHKFAAVIDTQVQARARDVFTVTSYVSPGGAVASVQSYTVLGYRAPERLDQLPALDLELIR